jgi:hypothetical protein
MLMIPRQSSSLHHRAIALANENIGHVAVMTITAKRKSSAK